MALTNLRGGQLLDGGVQRVDLDITTVGQSVIRKVLAGTGVSITSTGADTGTGDVTISISTVPVANGGTNITSYAVGDILYASGSGALSKLAAVVKGSALLSQGITTAPAYGNTIQKDAIGASTTDGWVLENTTAAAANAQQWSPRLRLTGRGWKTNATAASQAVDWIAEVVPIQGAANPSSELRLSSQINGGGYAARVYITSAGWLGVGATPNVPLHIAGAGWVSGDLAVGANLQVSGTTSVEDIDAASLTTPIIYGGIAASNNLTLASTLHATKGKILFGSSGYDEVGNNLGIGTTTFGTSAAKVLGIINGTAPSTSPADTNQIWSADAAAGDANIYIRNEAGRVKRLTADYCVTTSDFSRTSSLVLTNVTGLSFNVEAGKTYSFEAVLMFGNGSTLPGAKVAISGSCTANAIVADSFLIDGTTVYSGRATALGGAIVSVAPTDNVNLFVKIYGTITVNAAGTLTVQIAQSASNGSATTVKTGSYFRLLS